MSSSSSLEPIIVFRCPALSVEHLLAFASECEGLNDRSLIDFIFERCGDSTLYPLLLSASRDLVKGLDRPETEGAARVRTARALLGYLSRMCTRPTPFALLACVGLGKVGPTTELSLPDPADDVVSVTLSPYLGTLIAPEFGIPGADVEDPSAYRVRGGLRSYQHFEGSWRLQELASDGVLIPRPPMSSMEPDCVEAFISELAKAGESEVRKASSDVLAAVRRIPSAISEDWGTAYEIAQQAIDAFVGVVGKGRFDSARSSSRVVLCNRVCPGEITIAADLVEEIKTAAGVLYRLQEGKEHKEPQVLADFSTRFRARYSHDIVPLLEALDPGVGVGHIDGELVLDILDGELAARPDEVHRQRFSISKLLLQDRSGNQESISIDPAWGVGELAHTDCSVLGSLTNDERFQLKVVSVGDDTRLLGRFAPDIPGLADRLRDRVLGREIEDVIDAEIAHVPLGYDSNVVRRSALYRHEIVCSGRASVNAVAIPVNELLIGFHGDSLRLWWPRAEKWVRPRLSCAHNAKLSRHPVYRFLCDLAFSESSWLSWTWPAMARTMRLPAINCGRIELAPGGWLMAPAEMEELHELAGGHRMSRLREIRLEHDIPRWVQAGWRDNLIEVDLDNPVFVDVMLHKFKVVAQPFLRPSQIGRINVLRRADGSYCNELVIAYSGGDRGAGASVAKSSQMKAAHVQRTSPMSGAAGAANPGWLTIKIYDERAFLETLLVNELVPWVQRQLEERAIDRWHFLRYTDPERHLRVRFRGTQSALASALGELYTMLLGSRWSLGHYSPEVVRYGGPTGLEICESIFMEDSWAAAEIVRALPNDLAVKRWEISAGIIDGMFCASRVPLSQRIGVLERMRDSYAASLGISVPGSKHVLTGSYRHRRRRIEQMSTSVRMNEGWLEGCTSLYEMRAYIDRPVEDVVASLVHMHLNRVLGPRQMTQEVVIYDFMRRLYRSELARERVVGR